jgi:hypothetical protein
MIVKGCCCWARVVVVRLECWAGIIIVLVVVVIVVVMRVTVVMVYTVSIAKFWRSG